MDEVYDLFQDNMLSTDIVDLLAASEFMSEEVYNKKFSKVYRLDDLAQRFPRSENPAHTFPPELDKNVQKGLQFKITEYSTLIFQNLRIRQRDKHEFLHSLLPYNNTRTLTKSFEKTSARGGKPLIKTHDKRFLIKEIKKEEKDFFLAILSKYHKHLRRHPDSLMAKILGVFSIQIDQKDKVYHILMESLDPIDELFIKFKYDLKFSTVNRREYKSRDEVNLVRKELLAGNPLLEELFPKDNDLRTQLGKLPDASGVVGGTAKKLSSSNSGSADNKSKEAKRSKGATSGKAKTKSTDSTNDNVAGGANKKAKSNTNSDSDDDDSDEGGAKSGGQGGNQDDEDDDLDNDEFFKSLDYQGQLIYREQKYLLRQQKLMN
jgi:hypothetical protein